MGISSTVVGALVGFGSVGVPDGTWLGSLVTGAAVGVEEGATVVNDGATVGLSVLGAKVGSSVGEVVGLVVGRVVGGLILR